MKICQKDHTQAVFLKPSLEILWFIIWFMHDTKNDSPYLLENIWEVIFPPMLNGSLVFYSNKVYLNCQYLKLKRFCNRPSTEWNELFCLIITLVQTFSLSEGTLSNELNGALLSFPVLLAWLVNWKALVSFPQQTSKDL